MPSSWPVLSIKCLHFSEKPRSDRRERECVNKTEYKRREESGEGQKLKKIIALNAEQ